MKTKTFKPILAILIAVFLTNMYSTQAQKKQTETNNKVITIKEKKQEKIVLDLLEAFNLGAENVLELFDDEAIIEYPYAHSLGTPSSLNKTQYGNYLKGALANMPNIEFSQVHSYTVEENNIVWAEFHGEVIIPSTNERYKQDYVVRITLKKGKIINYKEYWNPMAISAMGDEKEVNKIFNDKSKQ